MFLGGEAVKTLFKIHIIPRLTVRAVFYAGLK